MSSKIEIAEFVTWTLLGLMAANGLWVAWDARRKGKPLVEVIVWGLFSAFFFGIGLGLYLAWGRNLPPDQPEEKK
ncbi:hypothetical protein [Desulfotomaculum copahuensis]|uniref:Uncharacterized protein n=1 Tax=Desulfotomaculum copahuensis TaxID=1838280 RepID=A0A1B7LEV0_9FIRM|nr:hypothetical protein [Desulfotomaculum copahuensis]OAT81747.1 hypothetical protein A6M21_10095 [Desulfotomaculum copahuensis]